MKPILVNRCLECHGSDRKGGLDLRSKSALLEGGESGEVVKPGNPSESLLIEYVESEEMPPSKPLAASEIAVLRRWIDSGAYLPDRSLSLFAESTSERAGVDWWSLQTLADVTPPRLDDIPESWSVHVIDRFVFARLREQGLHPSPTADKRALIRRATYDVTGLPPTLAEITAFEQDPDENAYERLIDRLLASPHYGEHWGRHWLDVVRFGESNGFERNQIIDNAWPFRDYIIRSFNEDKPYDQLVREHLSGDVVAPGDPSVEVGTTFLVCGPYDDVGNQDPEQAAQIRANTIDDMVRATGETFLGLTIGCGRCHNHKFDPISQQDYYSLYATFTGVHHGSREVGSPSRRKQRDEQLEPLNKRKGELEKEKALLEKAIASLAAERAEEFEAQWTRPPVDRRGTEETFEPTLAQRVRLSVRGTDTNPRANSGYRIDEIEVWTSEASPRNVALARGGGKATGMSRIAEDFADAYSAALAIDGEFGAPWIASGPELVVSFAQPEEIDRVCFSSDRTGAAGDQPVATFVGEYRIDVSLDGESWTEVASSATRQPVSDAHRKKRIVDRVMSSKQRRQQRTQRADCRGESSNGGGEVASFLVDRKFSTGGWTVSRLCRWESAEAGRGGRTGQHVGIGSGYAELQVGVGRARIRTAAAACRVDYGCRQSTDAARDGQSVVAIPLWDGNCGYAQRLWFHGRIPDAPRIARLARAATMRRRLAFQEHAQVDHVVANVSAGE